MTTTGSEVLLLTLARLVCAGACVTLSAANLQKDAEAKELSEYEPDYRPVSVDEGKGCVLDLGAEHSRERLEEEWRRIRCGW